MGSGGKRMITAGLLIMLIITLCVPVRAAAQPADIHPGWSQTVTVAPGETLSFTFVPEQSGDYILAQKSDKLILGIETEGTYAASAWVSGRYRGYTYTLNAGTGYTFTVSLAAWQSEACTAELHFTEGRSLEGAELDRSELVGSVGDSYRLNLNIEPAYDGWVVQWTSSDPSVVSVENPGNTGCLLKLLSEGSATVSATVEDLSVSCVVTVEQMASWGENKAKTVTLLPGGCRVYAFTPAESGEYVLYQGADVLDIAITQSGDGDVTKKFWAVGDTHGYRCELEAGVTYVISVSMWEGYADSQWSEGFTGTVLLEKKQNIQSVTLDREEILGYQEHSQSILALSVPVYGIAEGITWTSSDPQTVSISYSNANYCEVYLKKAGTATVTATAANGMSASCTVTVKPTPVLETEQAAKLDIFMGDGVHCHFTPEVSGYYQFHIESDTAVLAELFTEQGDHAAYVTEGGSRVISAYLEAGITCWLELTGAKTGSAVVTVDRAEPIESLTITRLPNQLEFIQDHYDSMAADPLQGLQLQVTWPDGSKELYEYEPETAAIAGHPVQSSLSVSEDGASGTVTITCGGASVSYGISFTENPVAYLEIVGQQAVPLIEGTYYTQDYGFLYYEYQFALEGLQLKVVYSDGTAKTVPWDAQDLGGYRIDVSTTQGAVIWAPGEDNTVTFRYLGAEAKLNMTMVRTGIERIELESSVLPQYLFGAPSSGTVKESGEYVFSPDLDALAENICITVYDADGTSRTVTAADCKGYPLVITLSPDVWDAHSVTLKEPGTVNAAVYYMGCFAPLVIDVVEETSHSICYIPEKAATDTAPGNRAYYLCQKCGRFFADEQGTQEILDHASVILPQLQRPAGSNPATGDESPLIPVAILMVLAAAGLIILVVIIKRSQDN